MPIVRSATLKALRNLAKGLVYTSESDGPIKAIAWSSADAGGASTPLEAVAKVAGVAPEAIVSQSVEAFLSAMTLPQSWWGEDEKALAARFSALTAELEKLTDAQAFRIGDGPDIAVYLIGGDPKNPGSFAGVKTSVTET